MSNYTTMQNNVVRAGKFIEINSTSLSMKERLRSASQAITNMDISGQIKDLDAIINDEIITPSEKVSLKERWAQLSQSYVKLQELSDSFGEVSDTTQNVLDGQYAVLYATFNEILSDMTKDSTVPEGFRSLYEEFVSTLTTLTNSYVYLFGQLQQYSILIGTAENSRTDLDFGEYVIIEAFLMHDTERITSKDDVELKWYNGRNELTEDDGVTFGPWTITIPYAALSNGNMNVTASVLLSI